MNAQAVLEENQVTLTTIVDSRKERIDADAAWKLLQAAESITAAKGQKVVTLNPRTDDKATILKQVIGPSGNLRAPALRIKNTFIIGFNTDLYAQTF